MQDEKWIIVVRPELITILPLFLSLNFSTSLRELRLCPTTPELEGNKQ